MQLLRFELSGKMAHFRKYYANNTALSYFLPPRTTLMGILAAILGMEKDSYYEALSSEQIRIGAGILSPVKKTFHRLNLLKIVNAGDFRGRQGRVQTPVEIVSGYDLNQDMVRYAVYVSPQSTGQAIFERICEQVLEGQSTFALSLGTANFMGQLRQARLLTEKVRLHTATEEEIEFSSAVNVQGVTALNWEQGRDLLLEEELTPQDFVGNRNRELKSMVRLLYTTDGRKLPVTYTGDYVEIQEEGQAEYISFIE